MLPGRNILYGYTVIISSFYSTVPPYRFYFLFITKSVGYSYLFNARNKHIQEVCSEVR